jgi:hypothetical protein
MGITNVFPIEFGKFASVTISEILVVYLSHSTSMAITYVLTIERPESTSATVAQFLTIKFVVCHIPKISFHPHRLRRECRSCGFHSLDLPLLNLKSPYSSSGQLNVVVLKQIDLSEPNRFIAASFSSSNMRGSVISG